MTDPRIQARRVGVQRAKGRRRLRAVLAVLGLGGLGAGGVAVAHSSLFAARSVVIAGAVHTSRAEVVSVTGLWRRPPLIDVSPSSMERELDSLPWVASSTVRVAWPSTVAVALVERVPVATAKSAPHSYALIDETGRVLAFEPNRPAGLPLVVDLGPIGLPGSSIAKENLPLVATAAALPVSLLAKVRSIGDSPSLGVVVQLNDGVRAVVGADQSLLQKFVSLATVLQRVSLAGVGLIDLRVPSSPVLTPQVTSPNLQLQGRG